MNEASAYVTAFFMIAPARTKSRKWPMKDPQREVEELRTDVNCATVIERTSPSRRLDKRESTRLCLKYRRGAGEIVIVTHGAAACLQSLGQKDR